MICPECNNKMVGALCYNCGYILESVSAIPAILNKKVPRLNDVVFCTICNRYHDLTKNHPTAPNKPLNLETNFVADSRMKKINRDIREQKKPKATMKILYRGKPHPEDWWPVEVYYQPGRIYKPE